MTNTDVIKLREALEAAWNVFPWAELYVPDGSFADKQIKDNKEIVRKALNATASVTVEAELGRIKHIVTTHKRSPDIPEAGRAINATQQNVLLAAAEALDDLGAPLNANDIRMILESSPALPVDKNGCTRSHPHEDMSIECIRKTEEARANNANYGSKGHWCDGCTPEDCPGCGNGNRPQDTALPAPPSGSEFPPLPEPVEDALLYMVEIWDGDGPAAVRFADEPKDVIDAATAMIFHEPNDADRESIAEMFADWDHAEEQVITFGFGETGKMRVELVQVWLPPFRAARSMPAGSSHAKAEGWKLVPGIGCMVKADHPITCLNPDEYFEVSEVRAEKDGTFSVRGEKTCWFGSRMIAAAPLPNEGGEGL